MVKTAVPIRGVCFCRGGQNAPLAQLDRALVYGTKGWGFELLKARQKRTATKGQSFFLAHRFCLTAFLLFCCFRGCFVRLAVCSDKISQKIIDANLTFNNLHLSAEKLQKRSCPDKYSDKNEKNCTRDKRFFTLYCHTTSTFGNFIAETKTPSHRDEVFFVYVNPKTVLRFQSAVI